MSTIHIDKIELENQKNSLKTLSDNKDLDSLIQNLQDIMKQSKGSAKTSDDTIISTLQLLNTNIHTLFQNTYDFINNTQSTFIEADEGLANSLNK